MLYNILEDFSKSNNIPESFPDNAYDSCLCREIVQQAKADRDIPSNMRNGRLTQFNSI